MPRKNRRQARETVLRALYEWEIGKVAVEASLARNVWRGVPPDGASAALARVVLDQATHLQEQPLAKFAAGNAQFIPVGDHDP